MNLERRILEELVYERVRVAVNLCQLVIFEQDLDKSIQRVIDGSACQKECQDLAHEYIDKAWERLQEEWRDMRISMDCIADD